jgi:hypothetical protein
MQLKILAAADEIADCSEGSFKHDESFPALISRGTSFRDPDPAFYAAIRAQFAVAGASGNSPRQTHWPAAARARML